MEQMLNYIKTGAVVEFKEGNMYSYGIIIDNIVMYIRNTTDSNIEIRGVNTLESVLPSISKIWYTTALIQNKARPVLNSIRLAQIIKGDYLPVWTKPQPIVELTVADIEKKLKEGGFIDETASLKIIKES